MKAGRRSLKSEQRWLGSESIGISSVTAMGLGSSPMSQQGASYRAAGVDYDALDAGKRTAMAKALSTSALLQARGGRAAARRQRLLRHGRLGVVPGARARGRAAGGMAKGMRGRRLRMGRRGVAVAAGAARRARDRARGRRRRSRSRGPRRDPRGAPGTGR